MKKQLIKLGNYKPSGHFCGNIYDPEGIAPTVMENHGCTVAVLVNGGGYCLQDKIKIVDTLVKDRKRKLNAKTKRVL